MSLCLQSQYCLQFGVRKACVLLCLNCFDEVGRECSELQLQVLVQMHQFNFQVPFKK